MINAALTVADGFLFTLPVAADGGSRPAWTVTGVGIALDAAARGLSVALAEKDDFASGTSGRSSR
ncbi:MAG: FAD-dependent oxidoreductase, partial [Gemmatimonadales bacterium]